jgi:hypothetical protein
MTYRSETRDTSNVVRERVKHKVVGTATLAGSIDEKPETDNVVLLSLISL